jgi:hypothetical protein
VLHHLYVCHPIMVMVIDPISVENRIWGDGNGTCQCDVDGSRLFVQFDAGSLWLVIIPKSKDRFIE